MLFLLLLLLLFFILLMRLTMLSSLLSHPSFPVSVFFLASFCVSDLFSISIPTHIFIPVSVSVPISDSVSLSPLYLSCLIIVYLVQWCPVSSLKHGYARHQVSSCWSHLMFIQIFNVGVSILAPPLNITWLCSRSSCTVSSLFLCSCVLSHSNHVFHSR